jgi:L-malate glycosyltransferase
MNVLHLSTATSWRGGEQQIAYLAGELKANNIQQTVCCPANSPLHLFCETLPVAVRLFEGRGFAGLGLARIVSEECRQGKISVIHAHDSHAHTAAVLAASVFGNRTPVVLSRRVDFAVSPNPFSHWKYNHVSIRKIICVSEKIKAVTGHDIRDQSKLCVVYDGIDLEKFNPAQKRSLLHDEYQLPASTRLIGNASALADHKDYNTFVDTAERVLHREKKVRFIILGAGSEKQHIENYIAEKQLEKSVILAGFRNNIPELLPELDIFLMTSITEGLGSVLLDAFASGVPVVATRAGGIPEIVSHNTTGLLAPVQDSALLAQHVCALLEDAGLSDRLRQEALARVRNFSKEVMAHQTKKIYEEVMNG